MEIKYTTEIIVEKTRRFIIRQPETDEQISCPACGEPMLKAETAAVLFQIKCSLVYRIVETGAIHFFEAEAGAMFVCPPSLASALGDKSDAAHAETIHLPANSAAENQTGNLPVGAKEDRENYENHL